MNDFSGRREPGFPAALLVFALLLAACGDDSPTRSETGRLHGRIEVLPDREPAAGARLLLLDPATNAPATPAAICESSGRFQLAGIPPGDYFPLVSDGRRILYAPLDRTLRIDAGTDQELDLDLATYPFLSGAGRPVRGRVVDAVDGRPLPGAWVSIGFTNPGFLVAGSAPPWETVTDPDGYFLLEEIPVLQHPDGRFGLYPILATQAGYRPAATGSLGRGELLPLLPAGDTLDVELALQPGAGERSIAGRVVDPGGVGLPGIPVSLSLADSSGSPSPPAGSVTGGPGTRALLVGAAALTDATGSFRFDGLWPGRYRVHVAYLPDDGWVPADRDDPSATPPVRLLEADRTDLEIGVLPGIGLVSPGRDELVDNGRARLTWRRLPGAAEYHVSFTRANSFLMTESRQTADTTLVLPGGFFGPGDRIRWAVQVYEGGVLRAASEVIGSLTVTPR